MTARAAVRTTLDGLDAEDYMLAAGVPAADIEAVRSQLVTRAESRGEGSIAQGSNT
jgi:hypothetical protein